MLPQGDDPPTAIASRDGTPDAHTTFPATAQEQEIACTPGSLTTIPATTPLVKAITTTISSLEDAPLTFCNRPPLPFRFPDPTSPGADHDETIIRMVDAGQSWGNIEALAGEEAFDRYYLFLDPSLEEFWTTNKVVELNDVVIDHVGRFLEPRVPSILKGINRPWYSKDATENEKNSKDKGEVNKVAKIYPVVVMAAWMDMFRWEKVARSVNSSPLVCQHIWETFGNGRPYSAEEEPFLDEIKVVAIENASRISAEIKEAVAKVEAARIQAEEEEEDRVEAIRVQEAKDEAERIEAIRIQAEKDEAERVEAAKEEMKRVAAEMKRVAAETKRIEANKARTIKRRAKVEAARAEAARAHAARLEAAKVEAERMEAKRVEAARVEIEKSEVMKVTAKKDPSRIQSAEICATKQQYIVMQEIISKDEPVEQEAAKRNVAIEKATRRQSRKETQEDAMAKDRSSREAAALAAAKAWDLAVRAVKDRGARVQATVAVRQKKETIDQAGLARDQNLTMTSNAALGEKPKIEGMEISLPPALANQKRRHPQNNNEIPPTIQPSTSSTSASSLISPAPSPLDESLDFHLSKRSRLCSPSDSLCGLNTPPKRATITASPPTTTADTLPSPASLLSDSLSSTYKALSPPHSSLPPSKDAETLERILKLNKMKKALADRAQSMVLQCQAQQIETEVLLRMRDAAIVAAKARKRGDSVTTIHLNDSDTLPPVPTDHPRRSCQETAPLQIGQPSSITPMQSSASLPTQIPVVKSSTQQVIDLTDDSEPLPQQSTASNLCLPISLQGHRPQQLQPQRLDQQTLLQQQYLQQLWQSGLQQFQLPQKTHQQPQQFTQPNIQQPPPSHQSRLVSALPQPLKPHGQTPQPNVIFNQDVQRIQEYCRQMAQESHELQRIHQQNLVEKQMLVLEQHQQQVKLAQEQQHLSYHLQAQQQFVDQQLQLQALDQIRQQEDDWKNHHEKLRKQEQVCSQKLPEYRRHTQQLLQAILDEQKKLQPSVNPEHLRQLHTEQMKRLSASQRQRYKEIQLLPVETQGVVSARLYEACLIETRTLLNKQKKEESAVARHNNPQESIKQVILRLQLQVHESQEREKQAQTLIQVFRFQTQEHLQLGNVMQQVHKHLRQVLMKDLHPKDASMLMEGTTTLTSALQLQGQSAPSEQTLRQCKERDLQRQIQLILQADLQQPQSKTMTQHEHAMAARHIQGHGSQAMAQGLTTAQIQMPTGAQGQAQTQRFAWKEGLSSALNLSSAVAAMQPPANSSVLLPLQHAPVVLQPIADVHRITQTAQQLPQQLSYPQPQPPAFAVPTTKGQPSPVIGSTLPLGLTPTAILTPKPLFSPMLQEQQQQQWDSQQQQPSQESRMSGSQSAMFPFPNPLYDITEWTAEDKDRLWSTWLEVGDDWDQISTKGLQGKFSADVCRAVILGTAS